MSDLLENDLSPDPVEQFLAWYNDALHADIPQANAMTLATSTPDGRPSARVVLMKSVDQRGFIFVTNYRSRKGKEIAANPWGVLVFHWPSLERQVRIEGAIEKTTAQESDALFSARARDHQLSSAASPQSEVITLEDLDRRYSNLEQRFSGVPVPRPADWGGYLVRPGRMEFWQHRFARMNDRVLYVRRGDGEEWERMRLAP